jgi:hypothetical protein
LSNWKGYTIDAIANDQQGQAYAREVLTKHNNRPLYRDTYQKMQKLDQHGVTTKAVFDSRETAYHVFNIWHREGLGELPNGTFDSNYSVEDGQDAIEEAYQSDQHDWAIPDWTTTWKLKEKTLGPNGPELNRNEIISLDW